jgi:hypothetical protein
MKRVSTAIAMMLPVDSGTSPCKSYNGTVGSHADQSGTPAHCVLRRADAASTAEPLTPHFRVFTEQHDWLLLQRERPTGELLLKKANAYAHLGRMDRDALADEAGDVPSSIAVAAKLALRAARQNTRRSSSWNLRFTIREL